MQGQEYKSPQLLAAKTSGDWVGGRNFWSPKQFLLKNPHQDSWTHLLLRLTPSELQHQDSSLKGTSVYREEMKYLVSRQPEVIVLI